MWATWWIWIAGGIALGVLELLAPGYIFLGFAVGAVLTGGLVAVGIPGNLPLALVIFAALSLIAWATMRRILGRRAGDVKIIRHDINDN
ncbi:hypothetical protein SAMN05421774_10648 [Gemmobacter megaterium]|uniref:NfeD-like C-terminal, partner-binding n=1 Tax=Gemmobacter megaterium TaxID=1086013 RepID=A0A1N7PQB7_9RHOB|nr:hypothetical protein [Gemmobacter megaterium]GGE20658.1 hypothetical protein GCM10011345_28070 [Gemmobacter megaterium]SIT12853.1 hypothetical protein SAMN05421774_10648 [Gemmobacter megaterium]